MRKWMIGMMMASMVFVFTGQALAEDAAEVSAGGTAETEVKTLPEKASVQGKAHAHHGKKKGHSKHKRHGHGKGHKKS